MIHFDAKRVDADALEINGGHDRVLGALDVDGKEIDVRQRS